MKANILYALPALGAAICIPHSASHDGANCCAGAHIVTLPSAVDGDDCPFQACFGNVLEGPDCTMSACAGAEGIRSVSGYEDCGSGRSFFQASCSYRNRFCHGCIDLEEGRK